MLNGCGRDTDKEEKRMPSREDARYRRNIKILGSIVIKE